MAFKDSEVILYDGTVKITYHDKAHRYYRRLKDDTTKDGWGKATLVKGVTTMMDNVLEKKGLMTWPMGLALGELFGFYNFKNERGEQMLGFSKGKGILWDFIPKARKGGRQIIDGQFAYDEEHLLPLIKSASEAWQRQKKKGADIGSVVHDAIEHFIKNEPFVMLDVYTASVMAAEYESEEDKHQAVIAILEDVKQANLAMDQFKKWWEEKKPKLLGAEELLYSRSLDFCGTYDGLLELDGQRVRCDWKTSKASASREAAAPQGVYYSYFIQLGFYELAAREMGQIPCEDLLCVSARKDGGFDTVLASEVGLTPEECIEAARCVWFLERFIKDTKKALIEKGAK